MGRGLTAEKRAEIAAQRSGQMQDDFGQRFICGAYCIYRTDELNWVVERETGTRAEGPRFGYYPTFPDCATRLLQLVTAERDKRTLEAVQAAYGDAAGLIASALARHGWDSALR